MLFPGQPSTKGSFPQWLNYMTLHCSLGLSLRQRPFPQSHAYHPPCKLKTEQLFFHGLLQLFKWNNQSVGQSVKIFIVSYIASGLWGRESQIKGILVQPLKITVTLTLLKITFLNYLYFAAYIGKILKKTILYNI